MTDSSAPAFAYYAQYCFHLSPTLNKWCPLRIADVQHLDSFEEFKGQNVFFYMNHPIKWVRIAGVIVAVSEYYGRPVYTVDDGSGELIECTGKPGKPKETKDHEYHGIQAGKQQQQQNDVDRPGQPTVGQLVEVKGELRPYRETATLQIQIVKLAVLGSTADEVRFWERIHAFADDVLHQPWMVDRAVVRECRRNAQRRRQQEEEKRAAKRDGQSTRRKKWQLSSSEAAEATATTQKKRSASPAVAVSPPPPRKKWSLRAETNDVRPPTMRTSVDTSLAAGSSTAGPTAKLTAESTTKSTTSSMVSASRPARTRDMTLSPPRKKKWDVG